MTSTPPFSKCWSEPKRVGCDAIAGLLFATLPASAAEPPAEPAQLRLIRRGERAHLAHDVLRVAREDAADQSAALVGECDRDEPPVVGPPRAAHEPAPREVADHHGGVAAAPQELAAEIALAEGAQVQESLQRAELADGQVGSPHQRLQAGRHRLGGPHQLDVGVERRPLLGAAPVVSRHSFHLNRCLTTPPGRDLSTGARGEGPGYRVASTVKRQASPWLTMRPAVGWWKCVPSTLTGRSA